MPGTLRKPPDMVERSSLSRMSEAADKLQRRLLRATGALTAAGIEHAVAAHVARVDATMTRSTQDVDLLVNRTDLPRIVDALAAAGFTPGFTPCHTRGPDMFLDGPGASVREAVHLVFAAEVIRPEHPLPSPPVVLDPEEAAFPLTDLEALVILKLNSNRDKGRVHLRDLIAVGLIDDSWPARIPAPLDERLQTLLDDPDG